MTINGKVAQVLTNTSPGGPDASLCGDAAGRNAGGGALASDELRAHRRRASPRPLVHERSNSRRLNVDQAPSVVRWRERAGCRGYVCSSIGGGAESEAERGEHPGQRIGNTDTVIVAGEVEPDGSLTVGGSHDRA